MSRIIGLRECPGCGELALVIKTNEGKKMAFDPEPLLIREDPTGDVFFQGYRGTDMGRTGRRRV